MNNFHDQAFVAHATIKNGLKRAILDGMVSDPSSLCDDMHCQFGVWIYGSGQRSFGGHPLFEEFRTAHAEFHRSAYDALMLRRRGDVAGALRAVEKGEFQKQSTRIVICIMKMESDPAFSASDFGGYTSFGCGCDTHQAKLRKVG